MAEALVALAAQAIIAATVSAGVGIASRAITGKPKRENAAALQPAPPRSAADGLASTAEVGGALPGIFGHRRVGGPIILSAKSGSKTYHVQLIAGARVHAVNGVYFNDVLVEIDGSDRVVTSPWANAGQYAVRVKLYDGTQTTADPWLTAAFPGWTADHKGLGLAYVVVEFDPDVNAAVFGDVFSAGIPDITVSVAGFRCYDPREPGHDIDDSSTWSYSDNAAICKANYLVHALGAALPMSAVDWASVETAADICDEAVPIAAGGTEARYRCAAIWQTDERHEAVLSRFSAADAGGVHLVGQQWRVFSGSAGTAALAASAAGAQLGGEAGMVLDFTAHGGHPSGKFGEAFIADAAFSLPANIAPADHAGDGLSWADAPPLDQLCNGVRGRFSSPLHNYEDRDFPPYQDAAALAADGREAWLDLDLAFVTSAAQAQRLAKIEYMRARFGFDAECSVNFAFFDVVADDAVQLTDDLAGFNRTGFRVRGEEVTESFDVRLSLEREDTSFFDWSAAEEQEFLAYDPLRGETGTLKPPGGYLTFTTASPTTSNVRLTAWPSPSAGVVYEYQYGAGPWTALTGTVTAGVAANAGSFLTVGLRSKNSASGDVSAAATIPSAVTGSTAWTEANTAYYVPPPPAAPRIRSIYSGAVALFVPFVAGARSQQIEIWENTTNNFGTATLMSTQTNVAGGVNYNGTGTPGTAKFYWARTKNATDSKFSGPSNPTLVVF